MWLTVDRGNTTLDCALGPSGTLAPADRVRLAADRAADLVAWVAGREPTAAIAATVVPRGLAEVREALRSIGCSLLEVGVDVGCPLRTAYDDPSTLGADRWLGALAAWTVVGGAVLTIDCGSALTVNAVTADGLFAGGLIAPGFRAMAVGLRTVAPALPGFEASRPFAVPATGSAEAVAGGVVLGAAAMVEGLSDRVASALGLAQAPRLVTGGDAAEIGRHLRPGFRFVPDLVHQGLRCLLMRRSSC